MIAYAIGGERNEDMQDAELIARDILILKRGDKNISGSEQQRLVKLVNRLDADISGDMLKNREKFISCIKTGISGTYEIGKATLTMLNAVYKSMPELTAVSMLGKVLLNEKSVDENYTMALLYRMLEKAGLTITPAPFGYNILKNGILENKLLEYTEPIQCDTPVISRDDLMKALFILNDEPLNDITNVKECSALLEYRRIVTEASGMESISLTKIPDFTSYPNMVLVMGLSIIGQTGRTIEFKKETFEGFVMQILKRQSIDGFTVRC